MNLNSINEARDTFSEIAQGDLKTKAFSWVKSHKKLTAIIVGGSFALTGITGLTGVGATPKMPDYVGMAAGEASNAVADLPGTHKVTFETDNGERVNSADLTAWLIESQEPAAGEALASVTPVMFHLTLTDDAKAERQAAADEKAKAEAEAAAELAKTEAPETPVSKGTASDVCTNAIYQVSNEVFPFGGKGNIWGTETRPRISNDGSEGWLWTQSWTVTNAFGQEGKVPVECGVSGTNANPVIEYFTINGEEIR